MNSRCIRALLASVCALLLGAACAATPVTFETTRTALPAGSPSRVETGACGFQLLLLIPIGINSRFTRAYQSLKQLARGDVIGNVSLRDRWIYAFVGTLYCTELAADVYRTQ